MFLQSKLCRSLGCRCLGNNITFYILPIFSYSFFLYCINVSCAIFYISIQRIEPYSISKINGQQEQSGNLSILSDNTSKSSLNRLSISQSSDSMKEPKSLGRLSVSQNSEQTNKDSKTFSCMLFFFIFYAVSQFSMIII